MRRYIFSLLIVTLLAPAAFATSRPSLDGRAVVAEEGVLPTGLFAKTVGYLPGDSVSVTNPATGITINVLVLGSIDPSAGVAILLSPEAADKLFITPDSNTQVRITKRTGMLDDSVAGSGTIISDTPADNLLPNQLKDNLDSRLGKVDKTLNPDPMDETLETTIEETVEPVAETDTPEPEMVPIEENDVELTLAPPVEDTLVAETPPPATDDSTVPDYTVTSVEEVPMNHVLAGNNPVYIVESVDTMEPIEMMATVTPECDEDTSLPEVGMAEEIEPPPAEEDSFSTAEEIALVPVEDNPPLASADTANPVDPFAPIILVPADKNPPLEADSSFTPVPLASSPAPIAESPVAKLPAPSSLGAKQPHLVKSLDQLERGKYYVQIATFVQQENIDNMLAEYGSKYPLVVVPMKNGKAMQIMVGPLNMDEYGAILAKFKNLGFKDSFLRKIR